ncbi:MAG: septum formation initiator family protein [Desulfobacterales bacterium]|nr:septum formation initiator family protein [Desulfobacterales bacterium]
MFPYSPTQKKILLICSILLALLLAGWILFAPSHSTLTYYHARKNLAAIQNDNARLERENKALAEEINRIENDPAYLEEVGRKQFGLLKKDEVVYDFGKDK